MFEFIKSRLCRKKDPTVKASNAANSQFEDSDARYELGDFQKSSAQFREELAEAQNRVEKLSDILSRHAGRGETLLLSTLRLSKIQISETEFGFDLSAVQTSQFGVELSRAIMDPLGFVTFESGPLKADDIVLEILNTEAKGKYSSLKVHGR